jgi:DNA-binding GntR family transcriptional regulator
MIKRHKLPPVNLESYKPLREIVFETIREAIISGHLRPGERLMEVQLAQEMGVSRTPVREAIRKLELEGLLIMLPRKGTYVAELSLKDIIAFQHFIRRKGFSPSCGTVCPLFFCFGYIIHPSGYNQFFFRPGHSHI